MKTLRRRYKLPTAPQMPTLGGQPRAPGQQPGQKQPGPRIGETKSVNGVTYRLNENSRWELASHDDPEQAHGAQAIQPGDVDKAQQAVEVDHKQRAAFVAKQLGQVDPQVGGLMRAMQAAPEFQKGAEYATKQIHPKQAAAMYAFLQQNAGQTAGGGEVRDLGNGNLGFSSPAGAIVVSAPGADGRHQVHYTAKTGVVDRAMQGATNGQQAAGVPANSQVPAQRQGQPELQPTAGSPAASAGPSATGQAVDGPVLSHEQDDSSQLRVGAESARADYENAIAAWEKAAKNAESGGKAGWFKENGKWVKKSIPTVADRKVLAQHRSKVASLRTIWKDKQSAVDQHGKKQAAAAKQAAKQAAKGKAADAGGASPEERELMEKTGLNLDQARRMMQPAKPLTLNKPKHSKKVQQALQSAAAALGIAMGGQAANPPESQAAPASKQKADEWQMPEGGGGAIPEVKKAWSPDKERWKQDIHQHLDSHGLQAHPDNLAAIQKAIDQGDISDQDQLQRVLARAKRIHDRGEGTSGKVAESDTPALKESLRSRSNRAQKGPYLTAEQHMQQAMSDHGLDEATMRNIVEQVHGEKMRFHNARESAKSHARKMLGVNRGTMNALERSNKDDAVDEDGEVARELAREYPELGMPHPDHFDGSEFDYSGAMQELLKEGPVHFPSKSSPEFWEEVGKFIVEQESGGSAETSITPEERERLDAVPFSKWGQNYRQWRYAKKSSPGQRGMFGEATAPRQRGLTWDEDEHPRDEAGRFSESDALAASLAIEQHPILQQGNDLLGEPLKPTPAPKQTFGSTAGKQEVLFGKSGKPGQMNIFADTATPPEMVSKEGLEAENEFSISEEPTVDQWNVEFEKTRQETGLDWGELIDRVSVSEDRTEQIAMLKEIAEASKGVAAWEPEDYLDPENFETGDWETPEQASDRKAFWDTRWKVRTKLRDSLKAADISHEQKHQYLKTAQHVLDRVGRKAIAAIERNLQGVSWYRSTAGITKKFRPDTPAGLTCGGCWSSNDTGEGRLHLDGDGGSLVSIGIYAHEFGHVADWSEDVRPRPGGDRSISRTTEWRQAFDKELADGQLTKYGATNKAEGFAEFARYCWVEPGRTKEKETEFPLCFAVFRKYGMV